MPLSRFFRFALAQQKRLLHHGRISAYFSVGDKVTITRKITQDDLDKFSELSGDTNPVHSSHDSERAIVHGAYLNSVVSGVIGTKLPGQGTIVAQQTLNFPSKCFVNETVSFSVEVVDKRKVVTVKFTCEVEPDKRLVLYGDAKLFVKK